MRGGTKGEANFRLRLNGNPRPRITRAAGQRHAFDRNPLRRSPLPELAVTGLHRAQFVRLIEKKQRLAQPMMALMSGVLRPACPALPRGPLARRCNLKCWRLKTHATYHRVFFFFFHDSLKNAPPGSWQTRHDVYCCCPVALTKRSRESKK